jgi:hypothetical protein
MIIKYEACMMVARVYPAEHQRTNEVESGIFSVQELLADSALAIPNYQRPYKWTSERTNQLS